MSSVTELLFPTSETTVILLGQVLLGIKKNLTKGKEILFKFQIIERQDFGVRYFSYAKIKIKDLIEFVAGKDFLRFGVSEVWQSKII